MTEQKEQHPAIGKHDGETYQTVVFRGEGNCRDLKVEGLDQRAWMAGHGLRELDTLLEFVRDIADGVHDGVEAEGFEEMARNTLNSLGYA